MHVLFVILNLIWEEKGVKYCLKQQIKFFLCFCICTTKPKPNCTCFNDISTDILANTNLNAIYDLCHSGLKLSNKSHQKIVEQASLRSLWSNGSNLIIISLIWILIIPKMSLKFFFSYIGVFIIFYGLTWAQ